MSDPLGVPPGLADLSDPQRIADDGHLRTLAVCHWVWAALAACGACGFGGMMIGAAGLVGEVMRNQPAQGMTQEQAERFGDLFRWMYGGMGVLYLAGGLFLAVAAGLTATWLRARRRRTLCMVASALQCLAAPFGTALGVFTLVVLSRPSVAAQFRD